jgi:hypothetical protein
MQSSAPSDFRYAAGSFSSQRSNNRKLKSNQAVRAATGISMVGLEERAAINEQLEKSAAREWRERQRLRAILDSLGMNA